MVALVMSFIIKRDSEIVDYEDAFGEMKTVDDVKQPDSNNTYGTLTLQLRGRQYHELRGSVSPMLRATGLVTSHHIH